MNLLFGADEYVSKWVASNLRGMVVGFGPCSAIGVQNEGRLIAGVVYHDYRPTYGSMQMSVYAERGTRWLSKDHLDVFFSYPFKQVGCKSVHIACARNNKHAKQFVARIGFRHAGLLRRGFGIVDAVLYDMLPEDCKWLRSPDERQSVTAARA